MERREELSKIRAKCYTGLIIILTFNGIIWYHLEESIICTCINISTIGALCGVESFAEWWRDFRRRYEDPHYRFFISYTSREPEVKELQQFIDQFVATLEKRFLKKTIFYDRISLEQKERHDERLKSELKNALEESGFVLAFISPRYFESEWCLYEWNAAAEIRRGRILPIEWKACHHRNALSSIDEAPLTDAVKLPDTMHSPHSLLSSANKLAAYCFKFVSKLCARCRGRGSITLRHRENQVCAACAGTGLGRTGLFDILSDYVNR